MVFPIGRHKFEDRNEVSRNSDFVHRNQKSMV
jgi:hypothetical protein